MSIDVRELLRSADGGPVQPDHGRIARRGRRLVARRTAAAVGAVAVAVTGVVGISLALIDGDSRTPVIGDPPQQDADPDGAEADETVDEPTPGDAAPERTAETDADDTASDNASSGPLDGPPSQSAEDAERDGVHPEIAARSFAERVDVDRAWTGSGTPRVVTDEGIWVASSIPMEAISFDDGQPLAGEPDGLYGRDLIDLIGYGEVLLLDHDEREILRAFPFPDFGPQSLVATDDAVYCSRQGDGGLPDSILCRIDRSTFEWKARIFPSSLDGWFPLSDPDTLHLPETWTVDDPPDVAIFQELRVVEGTLVTVGHDGQRHVDPETLELLGPLEPAATAQDSLLIERFLAFARDPSPQTAEAIWFADEVAIGLGPTLQTIVDAGDLADPAAWVIDVPDFRAYSGPFSALDLASDATETVVTVGAHDHCASPPLPAPVGFEDARRVSVQPARDTIDTCLHWWTVDLYLDEYGEVAAVTMDLWEP